MVFKHNRKQHILAIVVAFCAAIPLICLPIGVRAGISPAMVLAKAYAQVFGVSDAATGDVVIEDWALVSDDSQLVDASTQSAGDGTTEDSGTTADAGTDTGTAADTQPATDGAVASGSEDYSDVSKYIVYQEYDQSDLPIELLDAQYFAADNTTYYIKANESILKQEPAMDSVTVESLHLGQQVTRVGIGDTWSKIQTEDGSEGYVLTTTIQDTMLEITVDRTVWVDTDSLIVRSEASTQAEQVAVVNDEDKLVCSAVVGDKWYKVTTEGGVTGYVYISYTTQTPPPTPTPTPTPRPSRRSGGSSGSSSGGSSRSFGGSTITPTVTGCNGESIVSIAQSMLGVPYVFAGASRNGIDCSGLVMYCYAQVGISLPHGANAICNSYGASVSRSDIQLGDVVCYDYGSYCGHVAIYVGGGQVIHASNSAGNVRYGNVDMMSIRAIKRMIS